MRFWQLVSVFRDQRSTLHAVLERPQWRHYLPWLHDFSHLVQTENRAVLDSTLPDELCRDALQLLQIAFYLEGGWLHPSTEYRPAPACAEVLTALQVFDRFGGEVMEDTLEYGSYKVD